MKNVNQYQRDGKLHIDYTTTDGNDVFVELSDSGIVIHDAHILHIEKQYVNRLEIAIIPNKKVVCEANHATEIGSATGCITFPSRA